MSRICKIGVIYTGHGILDCVFGLLGNVSHRGEYTAEENVDIWGIGNSCGCILQKQGI